MTDTKKFVDYLINDIGIVEFCGVSDSTLKHLITEVSNRGRYVVFTNEGDAVAYAAGRAMSGYPTAVLMQNSGLTNASSSISSLTSLYNIPLVYIVGWRGHYNNDEPQHKVVGSNTENFIKSVSPNSIITNINNVLNTKYDNNHDLFILVDKGELSSVKSINDVLTYHNYTHRLDYIKYVSKLSTLHDDIYVLSTTGYTSRELMSLGEINSKNFYMFGSMGCLISFATGVAKSYPSKKFIVLDGDGSFLMRPEGSFISDYIGTDNLLHIIFKNGKHLSTGGQILPLDINEFIRSSAPYSTSKTCLSYHIFKEYLDNWVVHTKRQVMICPVSDYVEDNLPRPEQTPEQVKINFVKGLSN